MTGHLCLTRINLCALLASLSFVSKQGISDVWSPREIVLRWQLSWECHAKTQFGAYCEAYDDPDATVSNTQAERTHESICLGPTGNFQGTYKFFNLKTGHVIKRRQWTEFPMPDSIIRKVEEWAEYDK